MTPSLLEQFANGDAKRCRYTLHVVNGDVSLASLNRTYVGAMKSAAGGKFLLGYPGGFSARSHVVCKDLSGSRL